MNALSCTCTVLESANWPRQKKGAQNLSGFTHCHFMVFGRFEHERSGCLQTQSPLHRSGSKEKQSLVISWQDVRIFFFLSIWTRVEFFNASCSTLKLGFLFPYKFCSKSFAKINKRNIFISGFKLMIFHDSPVLRKKNL